MIKRKKFFTYIILVTMLVHSIFLDDLFASERIVYANESQPEIKQVKNTLTSESITDTSVHLSWTRYVDGLIALDYKVYRDEVIVATVDGLTYTDTELTSDREYTYVIEAKSKEGMSFGESNEIVVRTAQKEIVEDPSETSDEIDVVHEEPIVELEIPESYLEEELEGDTTRDMLSYKLLESEDELTIHKSVEIEGINGNFRKSIAAGELHTVGLKSDGTVVAVGANHSGQLNTTSWRDIVQVSAENHTVGLKSDGTVVTVGDNNHGQLNTTGWKDIVQVSAGNMHTVGLKSDGTVVAVGSNNHNQLNTTIWKDIIQVSAGYVHTVGLKSDGTVVAVGIAFSIN